jgi:hypothetical protein
MVTILYYSPTRLRLHLNLAALDVNHVRLIIRALKKAEVPENIT